MPVGGTFPLKMEGMELPMTLPECDRRGHTDSPQQFALAEARANAAADALIAEEEAATHQALDKRSRVKSKRRSRKPRPQQSLEPPTTRTEPPNPADTLTMVAADQSADASVLPSQNWNVPSSGETCIVCMDSATTHAFVPCGHLSVCKCCSEQIMSREGSCPVCRAQCFMAMAVFKT